MSAAPLPALIGVQLYRAIGLVFVILLSPEQLLPDFPLPAGWGDIAVGLTAPVERTGIELATPCLQSGRRPLTGAIPR